MPSIEDVRQETIDGQRGFVINYRYMGLNRRGVKGRVIGRVTSKFPLKAGDLEILRNREVRFEKDRGLKEFELEIFIPNVSRVEEMTSQQIMNAIQSLAEER